MSLRKIYETNKEIDMITRAYEEAKESKVTSVAYGICGIILLICIYTLFTGHLIFSYLDAQNVIDLSSSTSSTAIDTLNESYRWTLSTLFQGLSALLGIAFAFMIYRMDILDISKDRVAYGWGPAVHVPPPPISSHIGIRQLTDSLKVRIYLLLFYFLITALVTLSGLTFEIYFYNNFNLKNNIMISSLLLSIGVILLFFDLIYHITENKVVN
ncbi:MAG TPA: hypothetical protein HA262_08770 [Methanosarcina sp.]|jgi:hypothetical protein|nr:hypothetical protein [Methanosarcina sp.]